MKQLKNKKFLLKKLFIVLFFIAIASCEKNSDFLFDKARILAVIGLHGNTFKPHTGTKTSILFLQKWGEKEKIPTLFKKFSRADTKATNAGGSGLGLYLARVFIEAHHGKIWVESEGIGKGTTFFIELPANSTPVVYETSKA